MRYLSIFVMFLFFVLGSLEEGYGQMNRRSIRKNNKRLSSFRGKKFGFGKEKRYNAVGFTLNGLNYFGDLAPLRSRISTDLGFTRPALGISIAHRFGPRYTLQGGFSYGTLRGDDAKSADPSKPESASRYVRNLSFRNRIKELSVVAVFDLFENQSTYITRADWTPFAFLGVTVFHHNPKAKAPDTDVNGQPLAQAGQWVSLQPLGTEGQYSTLAPDAVNYGIKPYKRIQISIPFGIGLRYKINALTDFSFEFGIRYLFTDYIDDVSHNYVNLDVLNSELARAMSFRSNEVTASPNDTYAIALLSAKDSYNGYNVLAGYGKEHPDNLRGNASNKDFFTVTTFRLTYIIGKTFHRAKFR